MGKAERGMANEVPCQHTGLALRAACHPHRLPMHTRPPTHPPTCVGHEQEIDCVGRHLWPRTAQALEHKLRQLHSLRGGAKGVKRHLT